MSHKRLRKTIAALVLAIIVCEQSNVVQASEKRSDYEIIIEEQIRIDDEATTDKNVTDIEVTDTEIVDTEIADTDASDVEASDYEEDETSTEDEIELSDPEDADDFSENTLDDAEDQGETMDIEVDEPVDISGNSSETTYNSSEITDNTSEIAENISDVSGDSIAYTDSVKAGRQVEKLDITGQEYIAPGCTVKYQAKVTPTNATRKAVTWSIEGTAPAGVSINSKNGKVQVSKTASLGTTFTVTAKATDGSGANASKAITIKEKAKSVTIDPSSVTTIAAHASGKLGTSTTLSAHTDNGENISWKVSNSKIATISASGNKVTVTAVKSGTVTVTAFAQDGSGKKATRKIKVIVPVSNITLVAEKNRKDDVLASGGKLQFSAKAGDKYGRPTNSKVVWSYELVCYSSNMKDKEVPLSDELREMIRKDKAIFTFKNGKITAAKQKDFEKQWVKYWHEGAGKDYGIRVTATATDGTGLSASKLVKRVNCNTDLFLTEDDIKEITLHEHCDTIIGYMLCTNGSVDAAGIYITNSNPKVAGYTLDISGPNKYYFLYFHGYKPGKSTITIKTMDGSNLTLKIKVKVVKQ